MPPARASAPPRARGRGPLVGSRLGGAPMAGLADLVGAAAAELMGFYLLSSVLMMRGSLPHEFRQVMSL